MLSGTQNLDQTLHMNLDSCQTKETYKNVLSSLTKTGPCVPISGREKEMIPNRGGGYGFKIDDEQYVNRILILGTPNTYYVGAKDNTTEALTRIKKMVDNGKGLSIVNIVNDIYQKGRAAKQDPTFMVLAFLARSEDVAVRREAFNIVSNLRTISQVYTFLSYYNSVGSTKGWGRMVRNAFNKWISDKSAKNLVYQAYKYKSREGWTLRDILRCSHLNPTKLSVDKQTVIKMVVKKSFDPIVDLRLANEGYDEGFIEYVDGLAYLKSLGSKEDGVIDKVVELIRKYRYPREFLPTWCLNDITVWRALLMDENGRITMSITALIRNLGVMTSKGVFGNERATGFGRFINATNDVIDAVYNHITNKDVILKGRVHPANLATAYFIYTSGKGVRGNLSWKPYKKIADALGKAFYLSFDNVQPTNKRVFHAFDGSGSMTSPMYGVTPYMTSAQAVGLLGMLFAKIETVPQKWCIFSSKHGWGLGNTGLTFFHMPETISLEESARITQLTNWGSTDCSLPIETAISEFKEMAKKFSTSEFYEYNDALIRKDVDRLNKIYKKHNSKGIYDAFVIYTDNDINSGKRHPSEAIKEYRDLTGLDVRMVVVATTASRVSIADPQDSGMLDVVGFDTEGPKIISEFIRGNI